jgi:hypothetical protein
VPVAFDNVDQVVAGGIGVIYANVGAVDSIFMANRATQFFVQLVLFSRRRKIDASLIFLGKDNIGWRLV